LIKILEMITPLNRISP